MVDKKRRESFLSRKRLLSPEEYKEYKQYKSEVQTRKYKNEVGFLKNKARYDQRQDNYNNSTSGKVSRGVTKTFGVFRRGVAKSLYRNVPPKQSTTSVRGLKGTRGRPVGTVKYRDDNGNPIGVYEYRKLISLKRQELLNRRNISPAQAQVLNNIRQREYQKKLNREAQIIPDTTGEVFLSGLMDEIDRASNAVG